MTILLWIIVIISYMFVGAIIHGWFDSHNYDALGFFILFWPIALVFVAVFHVASGLSDWSKRMKRKITYKMKHKEK